MAQYAQVIQQLLDDAVEWASTLGKILVSEGFDPKPGFTRPNRTSPKDSELANDEFTVQTFQSILVSTGASATLMGQFRFLRTRGQWGLANSTFRRSDTGRQERFATAAAMAAFILENPPTTPLPSG